MTDQLLIGEVVCHILNEFKELPKIQKTGYGFLIHFDMKGELQTILEATLEECLTEYYNQMMVASGNGVSHG